MDETRLDQVSIRELLVALPLFGAILAITYDVGFFYGIGINYFTLFTLPEHVLFAFQAIPTAFGLALVIPSSILSHRMGRLHSELATPAIPTEPTTVEQLKDIQEKVRAYHHTSQNRLLIFSLLSVALGTVSIALKAYFLGVTMIMLGLSGIGGYFLVGAALRNFHFILWYVVVFMVMSFFAGVQIGRDKLETTRPAQSSL